MAALNEKIMSPGLSRAASTAANLFNRLGAGSSASAPEPERDQQVQASLDAVRGIGDTVSSTVKAFRLLKAETGVELVDLNSNLLELEVLSNRILDPSEEVNQEDAKRFTVLSDKIDAIIAENKGVKVTQDATLKDFLLAFEKKKGEVTVASKNIGEQAEIASNEIGGNFAEFLTTNIKEISTSDLGKAATDVAISSIAGPFAPIVQSLTGLVDTDKLMAGAKGLLGKGKDLATSIKGKKQADSLIKDDADTSSVDLSAEPVEAITSPVADLVDVNREGFHKLNMENAEDDEPTLVFREEQAERGELLQETVEDKLGDIDNGISDLDGNAQGMLGGIGQRMGSIAGSMAKAAGKLGLVAAAGAAGFGLGTVLNDKLNDVTGGKFGDSVGNAIGPAIDSALAFFGNEAAKDRLAIVDALSTAEERQENTTEALTNLVDEAESKGFLGFGGFDKEDFDETSAELKTIRSDASAPERVGLIDQQISTLQTTLTSGGVSDDAAAAIRELIVELRQEREPLVQSVIRPQSAQGQVDSQLVGPLPQQPTASLEPVVLTTPVLETPDQTAPLVPTQDGGKDKSGQSPVIVQGKQKDNVQSVPMVNDDLGMNLVNTGVI